MKIRHCIKCGGKGKSEQRTTGKRMPSEEEARRGDYYLAQVDCPTCQGTGHIVEA